MPDLEITIHHPNTRHWGVRIGASQLAISPAVALMDEDNETPTPWWGWGRRAFDEIVPPGTAVRASWDLGIMQSLANGSTALASISCQGDQASFSWFWESMIGTLSCPDGVFQGYSLGRFPGPIDLVRSVNPTGDDGPHDLPVQGRPWRVMVVRVDSDENITKAALGTENFLRNASRGGMAAMEFAGAMQFDGSNTFAVGRSLADADVVEIIAHGVDEKMDRIRTNIDHTCWAPLLKLIGGIKQVKVVLLNWCHSDFFRIGLERPAELLLNAGVPAVLAWKPRPWLHSLLPFQRGFYGALLNGAHVARACSVGRAAIFNALHHDDPERWMDAGGPRLYIRNDVRRLELIGRMRPPLR